MNRKKWLKVAIWVLLVPAGLTLLASGAFALQVLLRKPQVAVRSTTHASIARQSCMECHAPIAEEWRESYHYKSLTGKYWKEIRAAGYVDLFQRVRKACVNCHAPANVLDLTPGTEGVATSGATELGIECTPSLLKEPHGVVPAARWDDVELGVDCVSCHVGQHGITGSGRRPTAEHETVADRRFQDPALTADGLCGICHRSAVEAWKRTEFARQGITCLDCHMPNVTAPSVRGGPSRERRSHRFPADKDESVLAKAIHASLEITGDETALLRITNDRVGHFLPSGANWLAVYLRAYDASGRLIHEHKEALGREEALLLDFWPFSTDRRIPYGGQKELRVALPREHGRVEATIRYHDWRREGKTILVLNKEY